MDFYFTPCLHLLAQENQIMSQETDRCPDRLGLGSQTQTALLRVFIMQVNVTNMKNNFIEDAGIFHGLFKCFQ